jgi:guanylate kinase
MTKIFLSHSSKDKDEVRKLADKLSDYGISVWLDEWEIFVGDSITQKIESGIRDSDFIGIWITKSAIESGWVQKEWRSKFHEEISFEKPRILPLLAEDAEIPPLLRDKLYADFREDFNRGFDQLMAVPGFLHDLNSSQATKLLIVLAGPSGVGKDVIQNRLFVQLQFAGYSTYHLQKYTNREPRPEESRQSRYFHLSQNEFEKLLNEGNISCEHDSFNNKYGVDSNFCKHASPSSIVLYNIRDLYSVSKVTQEATKKGLKVLKILLTADVDSLLDRINQRSASSEEKNTRSETARADAKLIETNKNLIRDTFDLVVENSDNCRLREVLRKIFSFVIKHAMKK